MFLPFFCALAEVDVDGLHLGKEVDRVAPLLVRTDCGRFDATERQMHLTAKCGLIHVRHAHFDTVHELENGAHVADG